MSASERVEKTELFNPGGDHDFWLHSPRQVLAVLKRLKKKTATVTAYFSGKKSYILTAVLGLSPNRDLLILDEGPNEELNLKLLQSRQACCVTMLDCIRIRFDCADLKRALYKGGRVFVCPIPRSLLYLERRDCFRVATSVVHPPVCYVPRHTQEPLELLVVDISVGGVGLHNMNPSQPLGTDAGDPRLYRDCRLYLPDYAELTVDLRVRNARTTVRHDGLEVQKIGAEFMNLRPGICDVIQQYVHSIQLRQIATSPK